VCVVHATRAPYSLELATGLGPEGAMTDGQVMVNVMGDVEETGAGKKERKKRKKEKKEGKE
jgi:hypothetical protein